MEKIFLSAQMMQNVECSCETTDAFGFRVAEESLRLSYAMQLESYVHKDDVFDDGDRNFYKHELFCFKLKAQSFLSEFHSCLHSNSLHF